MSQRMTQGRQGMAQKMGQGMGQGMGNQALAMQYQRMIENWKKGMSGQGGQGRMGRGGSDYGKGTSPFAAEGGEADSANKVQDRQGDESAGDTVPTDFEALYAPEDYAHTMTSENQLRGQIDMTQAPEKVEEVRSAPETQEALEDYAEIIGAYQEGDESALNLSKIPAEYQELVKKFYEQLNDQSNTAGSGGSGGGEGSGSGETEDEEADG